MHIKNRSPVIQNEKIIGGIRAESIFNHKIGYISNINLILNDKGELQNMKIIKLVTLLLVTITLVGFNADDILDDNSPSWNIDNDSDGLPNALEDILGSNKDEKDSNMNLTDDKDELDGLYRYKLKFHYLILL